MYTPILILWIKGCQLFRIAKNPRVDFTPNTQRMMYHALGRTGYHMSYILEKNTVPGLKFQENSWAYLGVVTGGTTSTCN